MQRSPSPETAQLLEQARAYLPTGLFEQLEETLKDLIGVSQEYRADRKAALEARAQMQRERDQLQLDCIRYREERNHARRERELFRALLMTDEQPAIRPYLSAVLDAVIALSGAQKGIFMLFPPGGEIRGEPAELLARNCDEEDIAIVREQLELSQGIVRRALSTRQLVYTEEALTDSRFAEHASVRLLRLKTVLCAPLQDNDRALGVLYLEHRGRSNAFPESDRQLIELVVQQVSRWVSRQMIVTRATESLDYTMPYRERYGFKEIVGKSEALSEVLRLMTLSLDLNSVAPVLITGESGTGKELVARALHFNSTRARGPFVAVNCGAIPENLIESTLFGHARGAFTGADRNQPGKFEAATGGTLFLDEVAEMSLSAQVKLLRVLQDREVVRLGDNTPRPVDVRVIAATHRDLRSLIREGKFREDLFFRLDVFPIHIPPLRERREDVPLLAEHIVAVYNQTAARPLTLSSDAIAFLQQCELPGNVRELQNRLTRASMHATDGVITASLLLSVDRPSGPGARGQVRPMPTWKDATNAFQRQLLVDALRRTNRNLQEAAEMLGISRQHLSRLLHELNLNEHRPPHRGRKPRSEHGQ